MGRALITGASAGIGAAYARRLAADGRDLIVVARRAQRLDELADEIEGRHGVGVETIVADLAAPEDLLRVAQRAAGDDVDLLVNNAGINGYGPFADVDPAILAQVVALNVTAPLALTRAAVPGMLARGHGAVINVASLLAFAGSLAPDPLPQRATYAGTKGFMVAFSRTLAAELADDPVHVQVVCPGLTATEFHLTSGTDPVQGTAPPGQPHAMAPEAVVEASLRGLGFGEVVCIPGLDDVDALERLEAVESELRQGSRRELAERYLDTAGPTRSAGR